MYDIVFFFLSISVLKAWSQKQDSDRKNRTVHIATVSVVSVEWRYLLSSAATVLKGKISWTSHSTSCRLLIVCILLDRVGSIVGQAVCHRDPRCSLPHKLWSSG